MYPKFEYTLIIYSDRACTKPRRGSSSRSTVRRARTPTDGDTTREMGKSEETSQIFFFSRGHPFRVSIFGEDQ